MRIAMRISGMTCAHCQKRVLAALQEIEGVLAAEVNLEAGTAWVDMVPEVSPEQLRDAVEDWGYRVEAMDTAN